MKVLEKALVYNHLSIQFADDSEIHLLLTDKQISKAIQKAKNINLDAPITWIHELWLRGIVSICSEDKTQDICRYGLPKLARKFSHVRLNLEGNTIHLALENSPLKSAIKRADAFKGYLPKSSWLSDKFINEDYNEQKTKKRQITSASIG
jgi:hypothetical protein